MTGWQHLPLTAGSEQQPFKEQVIQFWKACRLLARVTSSSCIWPRTSAVRATGVIGTLTQNVDKTWTLTPTPAPSGWTTIPGDCSGKKWSGLTCSTSTWLPQYYDCIIQYDDNDPSTAVRAQITDNTSTTLKIADFTDYITAKVIPSAAALVSCTFYIIVRDGLWWCDKDPHKGRWPDWPNQQELWVAPACVAGTSGIYSTLRDQTTTNYQNLQSLLPGDPVNGQILTARTWKPDEWAGKELLVYGDDGYLHRVTIAHNDQDTLYWTATTWAATGAYSIVAAGNKGFPGRKPAPIFSFYGGLADPSFKTHKPDDDTIGDTTLPASTFNLIDAEILADCPTINLIAAFDVDIWTSLFNVCGPADTCYSPLFTKVFRFVQQAIVLGFSSLFLRPPAGGGSSYEGAGIRPNHYLPATLLQDATPNSISTSISAFSAGVATVGAMGLPGYPFPGVFYAVIKSDGSIASSGTATAATATTLTGTSIDAGMIGMSIVISPGLTRRRAMGVRFLFDAIGFLPSVLSGGGVVDPPAVVGPGCTGVGAWTFRPRSTVEAIYDPGGAAIDSPRSDGPLINGKYYRYVGQNFNDPTLGHNGGIRPLDPYYDHFYAGKLSDANERKRELSRHGASSGGGTYFLTDATKNWWQGWWYTGMTQTATAAITTAVNGNLSAHPPIPGTLTTPITPPYAPITVNFVAHKPAGSTAPLTLAASCTVSSASSPMTLTALGLTSDFAGGTVTVTFVGVLHTESGTASAGSNSSLTDAGTLSSPRSCYWASSRYVGSYFTCPYFGFTIEIDKTSGGVTTTYKSIITGFNASTGAISFMALPAGITVASGDVYRIREPGSYLLNELKDRILRVFVAGVSYDIRIKANDDTTIFFDPVIVGGSPLVIPASAGYDIIDARYGEVWGYTTTTPASGVLWFTAGTGQYWIKPTGNDTRSGTAVPWRDDQTLNAESQVTDYGFLMKGDCVQALAYQNELQACVNKLYLGGIDFSWYHGFTYDSSGALIAACTQTNFAQWDGTQWQTPTGDCPGSLYSAYGIDGSGNNVYNLISVRPFDGPPDTCDGGIDGVAPLCHGAISAHPVWTDDLHTAFFVQGSWPGPTSIFAYARGSVSGNCLVPTGNGIQVDLYHRAKLPCPASPQVVYPNADGGTTTTIYNCAFDNFGDDVHTTFHKFDTVTTGQYDSTYVGGNGTGASPTDGTFFSTVKVGHLNTDTVAVTVNNPFGVPIVVACPPLPAQPTGFCSTVWPDDNSTVNDRGYEIDDWFGVIDWSSYLVLT